VTSGGVFVNYRHTDSPARAAMIHAALEARLDEHVFLDTDDIMPGGEIAEKIEADLRIARVLIVVIGPHWLDPVKELGNMRLIDRKDDWVRHEIRSALKLNIAIVPVYVDEAAPLSSSWLPADIRAIVTGTNRRVAPTAGPRFVSLRHPTWDQDLAGFVQVLASAYDLRLASAPRLAIGPDVGGRDDTVTKHIIDFGNYIDDKTTGFIGRYFVFEALDQFFRESTSGYFLIRGDPGIGKSAVIARLADERGYPHHFNIAVEGMSSERRFFRNICAQLIARYGLAPRPLAFTGDDDIDTLRVIFQEAVESGNGPVVITVDALDEADPPRPGQNPLRLPFSLPDGAYIVASTRRTSQTVEVRAERLRVLELNADSVANLDDVRAFLKAAIDDAMKAVLAQQGVTQLDFERRLSLQSEGNFMYLRHVLPAIRAGEFPSLEVTELPKGLQGYYEHHWDKMRGQDFDRFVNVSQPIVATLATAHQPVSLQFVAAVTDLKLAQIQWTIESWNEFLHKTAQKDGVRYSIYHGSYRDFLATRVAG
jgi:hypothetical protein